ncbi:MAG: LamG-like jellyroll fold domain-containing protein, partial [bacterium]
STYYAGGGGGSGNVSYCAGGVGGGGGRNIAAVANTGGGGAGQWSQTGSGVNGNASAGGSGIVIVRYLVPSVIIGGVPAQNVNIVNSTTITASTSAHTVGLVDVTVVNPDQQAATSTNAFRYNDGIDNSTVLLLHANYTGSTFVDSSGTNKIVTAVGNTTQSVTQSKFGGKSAYFDGAGDYLSVADSEDFDFGSGDFTIDWWEYRTSATAGKASIQRLNTAAGVNPFLAGYSDGTNLYFYASSNGSSWDVASAKSMGPVSLNQWVHLAVVRSGNNFYTFKNGVQQGTPLSSSLSLQNVAGPLETGRYYGSYYLDGYIDDMRIAKGVARWTNDFTPAGFQFVQTNPIITIIGSTTASVLVDNVYTDAGAIATDDTDGDITSSIIINNLVKTTASTTFSVTYDVTNSLGNHTQATRTVLVAPSTVLLLHADASGNTFVDSSGTNKIVTANGNVTQVDRIQKFGGKSAYFDGGGDYLSIPTSSDFDFGNGNFTIDFWYYKSGTPETSARLFQTRTGDIYSGVSFYHNGANNLVLGLDTTGATPWELTSSNITIADNTWTHFAIVRNSTNIQVYKNGVSVYSTTLSGSLYYNPTDIIVIGGQSTPSRSINGYLDEFRVTKGIARWTSNFNPLIHAYGTSRILNIGSQPQIRKTIINNSSSGKLKIIKN